MSDPRETPDEPPLELPPLDGSRLRQRPPDPVLRELEALGESPDRILLSTVANLDLRGAYAVHWVILTHECILSLAEASPAKQPVQFKLSEISEVRIYASLGSAFLQVRVEELWLDVARFSNALREKFDRFLKKFRDAKAGSSIRFVPDDESNPLECRKCGAPLDHPTDVCQRCVRRGAAFGRVLELLRPHWALSLVLGGLVIGGLVLDMVPPLLTKTLVDNALTPGADIAAAERTLALLVLGLLIVYILRGLITIFNGRVATRVGTEITHNTRRKLFQRLEQMSIDYYDRHQVGVLMARVSTDTGALEGFINQVTQGFVASLLRVAVVVVFMLRMSPFLTAITLIPAPFVILGTWFFWHRIHPKYYRFWDSNSKLAGLLNGVLSGIRLVKAYAQEPRELRRFDQQNDYIRESQRDVGYSVSTFSPIMSFTFSLGGLLVWLLGGRRVIEDQISLGTLMAFFGYLGMFYQPLTSLTLLSNWLSSFATAVQRIFEILDTTPQIQEAKAPVTLPRLDGKIEFDRVTFGYDPYNPILRDVSLTIEAGEMIGIVGRSGSGKTTLVNLLARFYDIQEGDIRIDGISIREIALNDLRRQMAIVLQEPFLFRGTIADNIAYGAPGGGAEGGRNGELEQILQAARAANAHDFIMDMPDGYDTYLGERGAGLSGGERQRVSIARALMCNPRILILDEATSSIDAEAERQIQDALRTVTRNRTTIAIAHRLSTLRDAGRIIVVDDGRIVEQGSHEELMEKGGIYYRLVKIQTEVTGEPTAERLLIDAKEQKE